MKTKDVIVILLLNLLLGCAIVSWQPRVRNYEISMNQENTRFLVEAKIKDRPALLALDTGAQGELILFRPAAERMGFKFPPAPSTFSDTNGQFLVHDTSPCPVNIFNAGCRIPISLAPIPAAADIDGTVGWELINRNIMQIDVAGRSVRFLDKIPAEVHQWMKLRISPRSGVLALEMPNSSLNEIILIDTGNPSGVSLNPEKWAEWTKANPDRPKTLQVYYMAGSGVVVDEEAWAHDLTVGPLNLENVPVCQANASEQSMASNYVASLGLAALEKLDLIVDGSAGIAYVRPRRGPARPYSYNRAGMVFTRTLRNGEYTELKAHVLEGGPAYQAGIRNGDALLKVGDQWETKAVEGPSFLARKLPAGAKLDLTLKRGETTFPAEVILQDLFPPAASGSN